MQRLFGLTLLLSLPLVGVPGLSAQSHDHPGQRPAAGVPTAAGQAAFAAIREIVALLEADPATDWSKVDLEALRQHLITMDRVLMEARVVSRPVSGGIELTATGPGEVGRAIGETLGTHAGVLDRDPGLRAVAVLLPDGARMTVTAETAADPKQVARIRGLGFAGLLAIGDHHSVHHLALARGEAQAHRH